METINQSVKRVGNFTSSKIVNLFSKPTKGEMDKGEIFGKAAKTYIKQKKWERRLGRSLSNESNARPLTWGTLCEKYVFEHILGTDYELLADVTYVNPDIDYHSGSPDALRHGEQPAVIDVKSPETLNSFCSFYDCETAQDIIDQHTDGETYYYQLLSNAILTNTNYAELVVFCPYKSELDAIRTMARRSGEHKYQWIEYAQDEELPYLLDGGEYKNLKVIRWEITQAQKDALTTRILQAGKLLLA